MSPELRRKGGVALVLGAVVSILRVLPIVLADGATADNFPPERLEDVAFFAQLTGWHVSHVLLLALLPLVVFGAIVLGRDVADGGAASAGLMTVIGTALSMVLFAVATVLDGFVLPAVAEHALDSTGDLGTAAGPLTLFTHQTASIFGGTASAVLLVTLLFVGLGLFHGMGSRALGGFGIALGAVATLGYVAGLLPLNISDGFEPVGALLMASFVYLIAIGTMMIRRPAAPAPA